MTLRFAASDDDFDHEFFRTDSLSPIESYADEDETPPRSALRTTLGLLGSVMVALGGTVLCIYALVPNTGEPDALQTTQLTVPPPMASSTAESRTNERAPTEPTAAAATPIPAPAAVETATARAALGPAPAARTRFTDGVTRDVRAAHRALTRGDPNTAIARARRVVDATPERADAWLVLGAGYGALGDTRSATLAFRACALRGAGPEAATCKALAR